jgi:hypothetical protein
MGKEYWEANIVWCEEGSSGREGMVQYMNDGKRRDGMNESM